MTIRIKDLERGTETEIEPLNIQWDPAYIDPAGFDIEALIIVRLSSNPSGLLNLILRDLVAEITNARQDPGAVLKPYGVEICSDGRINIVFSTKNGVPFDFDSEARNLYATLISVLDTYRE